MKDEQMYLNTKPLPKLPSKFKIFKKKTKTKFHHLVEKAKIESQRFVSRIEIRTK